jgi:hypothetical protein
MMFSVSEIGWGNIDHSYVAGAGNLYSEQALSLALTKSECGTIVLKSGNRDGATLALAFRTHLCQMDLACLVIVRGARG